MGLPHSHRISRVLCYSGTPRSVLKFRLRDCYSMLSSFPTQFNYVNTHNHMWVLTPFIKNYNGLGSYPFARHYLGNRCFTFFSSRYLDGSVPWVPLTYTILFMYGYQRITAGVFPHSEIFGSRFICNSPKLIAAYHVFHRRLVPRHPPYALHSLIVYIYKTNC